MPSETTSLRAVPVRFRKTNRVPEKGSCCKGPRHRATKESNPLRKSAGCTASKIRSCGTNCNILRMQERLAEGFGPGPPGSGQEQLQTGAISPFPDQTDRSLGRCDCLIRHRQA